MKPSNEILVFGEVCEGQLSQVSLELLSTGKMIANVWNQKLSIVIVDRNAHVLGGKAISHGADKVYAVTDSPSDIYEGASVTAIIQNICQKIVNPSVILLGQTLTGRDLAPRLAFRLKTGLVTDCISLTIDPATNEIIAKKPVSGGNVHAVYTIKGDGPKIVALRRKTVELLQADANRTGEIVSVPSGIDASALKARLIKRVREISEGPNIETADIVVAGGRGVGSAKDFDDYIKNGLANVLNAGVGATRAAVDSGFISEQHQVGLTGKIVGPSLYFAVALSGAIQHMAGCSGAKNIIAINKDENAQIFKFARFGVVADYKKVLPPLTEKLKEM